QEAASDSVNMAKAAGAAIADSASNLTGAAADTASAMSEGAQKLAGNTLDGMKNAGSMDTDPADHMAKAEGDSEGLSEAAKDTASETATDLSDDNSGATARSAGEGAASAAEAIQKTLSAGMEAKNIVLEGVTFATNSNHLSKGSLSILDSVAENLNANTAVNVEIAGYTDNTGDAGYNKGLSQKRAEAVREYLISKGVSDSRMTAKGYGIESPIADNTTSAGRKKNRRVELHVK
ncbi:MAG TPA: OmpA family protein, partial [Gammaproteobacteria bacterium]|nr:OmpA family protein [Gammaproteobacteria bacterium]